MNRKTKTKGWKINGLIPKGSYLRKNINKYKRKVSRKTQNATVRRKQTKFVHN